MKVYSGTDTQKHEERVVKGSGDLRKRLKENGLRQFYMLISNNQLIPWLQASNYACKRFVPDVINIVAFY